MVRLPKPFRDSCYIYVVGCGPYHKVGVAADIGLRIEAMRIGNPYPLTLVTYSKLPRWEVWLAEKQVHTLLGEWAMGREWFSAPLDEIKRALKIAAAEAKERHAETRRVEVCRLLLNAESVAQTWTDKKAEAKSLK